MKRKRRTEILIRGDRTLSRQLAEQIEHNHKVELWEKPDHGLVMIKMRETAQNTRFYIGEMLVTEVKVKLAGEIGIGLVQGDEPELAYDLAVIDAAFNADVAETVAWESRLLAEESAIQERLLADQQRLMLTKVNFETMQEEDQT